MKDILDKRIVDFLGGRGITEKDMPAFLHPKIDMLYDPYLFCGMAEAVSKIRAAIAGKKQILVYGDYDCDGISASSILYLYLKEKGAIVRAFIPSRFDDGYGLSHDTIVEICSTIKPDLIITVDLGITAAAEVEELKNRGIDVIVTDHHEPTDRLPDCIAIDAKVPGQKYPFDGLCGAGVALKLVEALEGREFIKKYLDLCAIATIGDIVPLVDENRVIASLGLQKINSGDCRNSIKFLLKKLNLEKIGAEDVSFRIVPRLNASGRMDNGRKVLDFLVEDDASKLEELYFSLDEDNNKRLSEISQGNEIITEKLKNIDVQENPAILVVGDFHQGVLGILASRVCHDYNRPAIIFTRTAERTLKGSGRSMDCYNIHSILCEMSDLFIRFGGHKMAIGLEISEDKFDEFKCRFLARLKETAPKIDYSPERSYDIEITDEDINLKFINQLNMLEPFGCKNEKPVLMLRAKSLVTEQMKGKNFHHYKLYTPSHKQIIAFGAYKNIEVLKSDCNKKLFVELEENIFNGKKFANCKLRDVVFDDKTFNFNSKIVSASSVLYRYISLSNKNGGLKCTHLPENGLLEKIVELGKQQYGTVVICQSVQILDKLLKIDEIRQNYVVCCCLPANKQNCILISSTGLWEAESGYNNYIYTKSALKNEHYLFDSTRQVYDPSLFRDNRGIVDTSRTIMGLCYNTIKQHYNQIFANDIFEYAEKLSFLDKRASTAQFMFALLVFADLEFIQISSFTNPIITIANTQKRELTSSKFYNSFIKEG